ncbi:MAG: lactoylglutathione lyase [Gammaproteobacteria bacterium]|jgi:lactoylglutathione lyase|nr:lactoylglutathione lyase [Gammaproteobacteria bacterium]
MSTQALLATHRPQLLHAMLRVCDLSRALNFYCGVLGLRELRRIVFEAEGRTLVFLGMPDDVGGGPGGMQIELWQESDGVAIAHPPRAGHVGIGVRDIAGCVATLAAAGVEILKHPAPVRPGGRVIAMIRDPDGHEIELLASD